LGRFGGRFNLPPQRSKLPMENNAVPNTKSKSTKKPQHAHSTGRLQIDKRAGKLAAEVGSDDDLLNTTALAEWLGVSTQWVEIGRSKNFGPPFQLLGSLIRKRRGAVKAWLREREHRCTAEYMKPRRQRERAEA
jgi:hypothetical protein